MTKCFAIAVNGKHVGTIIGDKIYKDPTDNYLFFMDHGQIIAMFPAENIEISTAESRSVGLPFTGFTEYQSNRI